MMTVERLRWHIIEAEIEAEQWEREGSLALPALRRRDAVILRQMLDQQVAVETRGAYTRSPA